MSEPIQSISQGNYVLQGTVATSAGIVGDGSTQNPLRADETVLWSGTYSNTTTSISLSEPTTNFNTIKVYWQHQTMEKPAFEYAGDSEQWYAIGGRYVTPNNIPCVFQCFWSGNYNQYYKKFCNYQFGSLTAEPQDANELVPIKVIGINRKAQ